MKQAFLHPSLSSSILREIRSSSLRETNTNLNNLFTLKFKNKIYFSIKDKFEINYCPITMLPLSF